MTDAVSNIAQKRNKNAIMLKTIEYGIYTHYLAVQAYDDVWVGESTQRMMLVQL